MSGVRKKVALVHLAGASESMGLAESLRAAGADVRDVDAGDCEALLDMLQQGWMPVVLKPLQAKKGSA